MQTDQIDQVSLWLKGWVSGVLQDTDVDVSLKAPGTGQPGRGIGLYLMDVLDSPHLRNMARPPLQVLLRYLVTSYAPEPEEAQRMFGSLMFAAMENPEMEVRFEPLAAAAWQAFGVPPQPSFLLCVPLRRERPEPETPLVRKPLVVQTVPTTGLYGLVIGVLDSEEHPLAGARVEIPALRLHTETGPDGRFSFTNVPAGSFRNKLCVKALGREIEVSVADPTSRANPAVIRLSLGG